MFLDNEISVYRAVTQNPSPRKIYKFRGIKNTIAASYDTDLVYVITKFLWESNLSEIELERRLRHKKKGMISRIRSGEMVRPDSREKILTFIKNYQGPMRSGW